MPRWLLFLGMICQAAHQAPSRQHVSIAVKVPSRERSITFVVDAQDDLVTAVPESLAKLVCGAQRLSEQACADLTEGADFLATHVRARQRVAAVSGQLQGSNDLRVVWEGSEGRDATTEVRCTASLFLAATERVSIAPALIRLATLPSF